MNIYFNSDTYNKSTINKVLILKFLIYITIVIYSVFYFIKANASEYSEQASSYLNKNFRLKYFSGDIHELTRNPTLIGVGVGGHQTLNDARAVGFYLSGMTPIGESKVGIYGRAELIRDDDIVSQTRIYSWKAALGLGYYFSESFVPFISLAQCYPSQTSCYNIPVAGSERERDTDAIYLGIGAFFQEPFFNQYFEISIDWSPYSNHNSRSLYLGYAFSFE